VSTVTDHNVQCAVTRNGYPCSRPQHSDNVHDFPMAAYPLQVSGLYGFTEAEREEIARTGRKPWGYR